jgi:hypothetical protein
VRNTLAARYCSSTNELTFKKRDTLLWAVKFKIRIPCEIETSEVSLTRSGSFEGEATGERRLRYSVGTLLILGVEVKPHTDTGLRKRSQAALSLG